MPTCWLPALSCSTSDDMSLVMNMACAFRDNAISRALFDRNHVVEQSIFAEVNGVARKCRPTS